MPVVNKKAAKSHPKMEQALNKVDAKLTTKQLTDLNKKLMSTGKIIRLLLKIGIIKI